MTAEQERTIRDMRNDGIGYMTIAHALGLSRDKVRNYCMTRGLNGRKAPVDTGKSIEDIQDIVGANWTVVDKKRSCKCSGGVAEVTVRCNICGAMRVSRLSTISGITCATCKNNEIESRKIREEEERRHKQEQRRLSRLKRIEQNYKQETLKLCECIQCGKQFIAIRNRLYCSDECARKKHNKAKELSRRMRLKSQAVDRDISLQRLYDRDRGMCYICGSVCDWSDGEWKDGIFYAGDSYPSIDHVVPLAKNGKHSWSNVRLAHRICNSRKGAK